jgi:signal peptide peptidase SppA
MKFAHLATRLYNTPLLITPEKAAVLEAIFRARLEGRPALESPAPIEGPQTRREQMEYECASQGMQRADGGYWRTQDGVALLPVMGTLVQRADSLDAMSGLTGYTRIGAQLQAALDDPRVDAILLQIDSPGGEVNGLVDLTSKVAAASQKKPTWAIADEQAFSAAYWLASAAAKVYAPRTAMVGSIGVYMMHQDQSQKNAKAGVTYTPVYAGARKLDGSPHAPLTDEARAIVQARVDEIYNLFAQTVADNRGVDEQAVRDTEAAMLNTTAAQDVGLIDGVASFDETLAALAAEAQKFRMRGRVYSPAAASLITDLERNEAMPDNTGKVFTQTDIDNARAAGKSEADQAAKTAAKTEADQAAATASKEAQARISAILGHEEAKDRQTLAKHFAFNTQRPVDEVVADLKAAPKETAAAPANQLAAAMARAPNPKVGPDVDGEKTTARTINAASIFAKRRAAAAEAAKQR